MPKWIINKADYSVQHKQIYNTQKIIAWSLAIVIIWLSIPAVQNLFFSSRQIMNTSFNRWDLVNAYGAFSNTSNTMESL